MSDDSIKIGFFYQKSRYDEKSNKYVFSMVILGPDRNQKRELVEHSDGYDTLFDELYALSIIEKTFFRECSGWSIVAAERTIFPDLLGQKCAPATEKFICGDNCNGECSGEVNGISECPDKVGRI